ncbi:MAG TPA: flagellar M-ring protein FliF, partial [Geomonas sp.]|nr:flagellar M-ring protein FliF [Geomonas sp.]
IMFVLRPLLKTLKVEKKPQGASFLPLQTEEENSQMIEQQKREQERLRLTQIELVEKVKQDPYQVAQILQNWLAQKE